jgi:hypothetical protein
MPYKSAKQEKWAHTASAKKAGFPTAEFDVASKGKHLPETVHHKKGEHNHKVHHVYHGGK